MGVVLVVTYSKLSVFTDSLARYTCGLTEVEVVVLGVTDGDEQSKNLDDGCIGSGVSEFPPASVVARHLFTGCCKRQLGSKMVTYAWR